jgi:hypothetical protein
MKFGLAAATTEMIGRPDRLRSNTLPPVVVQ